MPAPIPRIYPLCLAALLGIGTFSEARAECDPPPLTLAIPGAEAMEKGLNIAVQAMDSDTGNLECTGYAPPTRTNRESPALWYRFALQFDNSSPDSWLATTTSSGFELICIHWPLGDGNYQRQCAGESVPTNLWPLRHERPLFPLPERLSSGAAVYVESIHITREESALRLYPMTAVINQQFGANLSAGMLYGVMAVVAIACLAASQALRDIAFFWYGIHLAALGSALFGFSGLGAFRSWTLFGDKGFEVSLALLALAFAFACQFARLFLNTAKYAGRWDKALLVTAFVATIAAPLAILLPAWIEPVVAMVAITTIILMFVASLQRARAGIRSARYLLIGALAFGIAVVGVALDILGVMDGAAGYPVFSVRSGAFIAALCMLLGLIYRTHMVRQQRDDAMANALAQHRIALHRVTIDEVTGLASRQRLLSAGTEAMSQLLQHGGQLAMLIVDLDRFKLLEKTHSHPIVDRALKIIAQRLQETTEIPALIARPTDDAFALLIRRPDDDGDDDDSLLRLANRIRNAVATPLRIGDQEIRLTATIGVAVAPTAAHSFEALQVACNLAVLDGKNQGGNVALIYRPGQHDVSAERTALQSEFWNALEGNQLHLHYQPMVAVQGNRLLGYEALVRWLHPKRGQVRPDEFLPQIEGTHLMVELGRRVQQLVCEELSSWKGSGVTRLKIAINVSAIELQQPDFVANLLQTVDEFDVEPSSIELELTESSLVQNLEQAAGVMQTCAGHGIDTMVDDFGTGYSSLAYIRDLPLAGLKIDRSFTHRIEESEEDRAIVKSIIQLAHNLGLRVVAEGVETTGQRRFLRKSSCDILQGFLIGSAEPMADSRSDDEAGTAAANES